MRPPRLESLVIDWVEQRLAQELEAAKPYIKPSVYHTYKVQNARTVRWLRVGYYIGGRAERNGAVAVEELLADS